MRGRGNSGELALARPRAGTLGKLKRGIVAKGRVDRIGINRYKRVEGCRQVEIGYECGGCTGDDNTAGITRQSLSTAGRARRGRDGGGLPRPRPADRGHGGVEAGVVSADAAGG